jgi:hypothetical protein
MSRGDYLTGLLFCAAYLGLAVAAALVVIDRQLRWLSVGPRVVAGGLLTATAASTAQLIPLVLGVLTRGTVVFAALLLLGLAWLVPRSTRSAEAGAASPDSGTATRVLAGLALAVGAVYVIAFLIHNRSVPIGDYDSTSFILPVPARWLQTGSLWHFDDLVPGWGYGAYPQTGSLFQLVALLPWHNDFALRLVNVLFMLLAVAATTELAVELGAARAAAVTFAVVGVLVPAGAAHALDHAQPDMIMASCFLAAALFLLRYLRTGAGVELALAGAGLGLSLGTKWYAGPGIVALVGVWIGGRLARRDRLGAVVRDTLVLAGVALLVGGVWLLRNLVVGGDPLFPGRVSLFGITIFNAPPSTSGSGIDFSIAHYLAHPSILRHYVWPAFQTSFGWASALIVIAGVVAVARGRADRRIVAVGIAALVVFLVYTLMPYSALGPAGQPRFVTAGTRYAAPALLLAAACAACAFSRVDRRLLLGVQVLAVVSILDAIRRYDTQVGSPTFHVGRKDVAAVIALIAVAVLAWFVITRLTPPGRRRLVAAVAAALGLVALAAAGRKVENQFNDKRYATVNSAFSYLEQHAPRGARVALAGEPDRDFDAAPYIAFGRRLDNRVTFIGTRRRHLLLRYKQAAPFKDALTRGRYQFLLLGDDIGRPPPELAWAHAAGWHPVASGGTFTVMLPPSVATARSSGVSG